MIGKTNTAIWGGRELHGAIISITTDEETLIGKDVVLSKEDVVVETVQFDSNGICSFIVQESGDYVASSSDGSESTSESITVTNDNIIDKTVLPITLTLYVDGATVVPVDDVMIWMKCGRVKGKKHTTVEEVIADTETLFLLMSDENAMKYLERSTGFSDAICADEIAMTYLGQSPYVDGTVLNSDLWVEAIGNSTYWRQISKTVKLYGGVLENITLDDNTLVSTNSDGSVTISVPYGTHTYKGHVSNQSFVRTINRNTNNLYVMPEGALYWYGNMCTELPLGGVESMSTENGWNHSDVIFMDPQYRTNSVHIASKDYYWCAVVSKNAIDLSKYSKLKTKLIEFNTEVFCRGYATKNLETLTSFGNTQLGEKTFDISAKNNITHVHLDSTNATFRYGTVTEFYLE